MITTEPPEYIEMPRAGRRPRYHRLQRDASGEPVPPPQCALGQAAQPYRVVAELPRLRRPLTQLCHRCFRGSPLLEPLP